MQLPRQLSKKFIFLLNYCFDFLDPVCHCGQLWEEWQLINTENVPFAPLTGGPHMSGFFFLTLAMEASRALPHCLPQSTEPPAEH